MAENNNVQKVEITTTEISMRATSLRARLTDLVTIRKCGNADELREARVQFDKACAKFIEAIGPCW